jgi:hypothetical protein
MAPMNLQNVIDYKRKDYWIVLASGIGTIFLIFALSKVFSAYFKFEVAFLVVIIMLISYGSKREHRLAGIGPLVYSGIMVRLSVMSAALLKIIE